jgi:lysophospholipase L1-like esterase
MHYPDVIQRERVRRWIASDTAGRPSSWFFRTVPDDRAALFERDLERFVTAVEQGGAIPVLVTHAVPFAGAPAPDQEALMEAWRRYYPRATTPTLLAFDSASAAIVRRVGAERGVPVVDAAGALNGQRAVFADFTHFTDSGAGRMADLLAAQVTATEARR